MLHSDKKAFGFKERGDRITVLLCVSKNGDFINPLFVGKYKNPRVFKGTNLKELNINYVSSKRAWMNKAIFNNWLCEINHYFKLKNKKIVLFLDNCSAHCDKNLSNIKLVFYPPNTSSIIQPLDLGIIKNFKDHFRNFYMNKVVLDSINLKQYQINLLDAIIWAKLSVWKIKKLTVQKCFERSEKNILDLKSKG